MKRVSLYLRMRNNLRYSLQESVGNHLKNRLSEELYRDMNTDLGNALEHSRDRVYLSIFRGLRDEKNTH